MIDINFIQALRDKLKGGTTKSIHLNALPGRFATRLDLGNLNYINPEYANEFLKVLFTKACFEFKISFDSINLSEISAEEQKRLSVLSKRFNSLNYENDDNYKEHGIKTFSFGYPLLIKPSKQDPRKLIKAPLFIWQLEIVKATNKVNTWSILRNKVRNANGRMVDEEIHSVGLNEVLLSYLKTDESILIPQINEELLEDAVIDKQELIEECYKVLKALNPNTNEAQKSELLNKLNEPVKNIPEAATIDSASSNMPWIYFGGVFGLFRAQKESIIGDIDKIIENYDEFQFDKLIIEQFPGTAHSAVQTDPSQQGILSTLNTKPRKIIQGPPGTGKSQTLTALITNALANNLKCLVVCEKKTALDVIKHNLERESEQIGALAAVIEDINKDRDAIVNSVRDRLSNLTTNNNYNTTNYDFLIKNLENTVIEYNHQHKLLDKKIFHGKKWTNLVGEFLKHEREIEQGKLKHKLDYKQFKFHKDENELLEFVGKIRIAQKLFSEINDVNHPLNILNDSLFQSESARAIQLKLEESAMYYPEKLTALKSELIYNIDNYKKWLDNHYSEYHNSILSEIEGFETFVSNCKNLHGDLFFKNSSFIRTYISILSVISNKYKTIKINRLTFLEKIDQIKSVQQTYKYFDHNYIETKKQSSFGVGIENIEQLKATTKNWYRGIEAIKLEYLTNFGSSNIHSKFVDNKSQIESIEDRFDKIIAEINKSETFVHSQPNCNNYNQRVLLVDSLHSKFQIINDNITVFREYYDWRKYFIELSDLQQIVINSLVEIKSENWILQFESWYFYWLL